MKRAATAPVPATFAATAAAAVLTLSLGVSLPAYGAYTYYLQDQLSTVSAANWTTNGSISSTGANGITSATTGAIVSNLTAPNNPNDYEVSANIWLNASGGNYGLMLRASSNAMYGQGSYYMIELQNPQFANGGCSATLSITYWNNNTQTTIYSASTWCGPLVQLRAVMHGGMILVYQGGLFVVWTGDNNLATGKPGLSVRGAPSTNSMNWAFLGPTDAIAPNAVDPHNIATTALPNRIDMQWQGASDDINGTGVAFYIIYRGGQTLNYFTDGLGEFSDNTVAPSTSYNYNITACDYHGNCTGQTFTATSAPLNAVDPRRIGVKPTSVTWGAKGENIDIYSGNLNFTLPLLSAKGRGGTSLGIALNYNSQNWRQDGNQTIWNYGRDIGYGYGFRVMAGSMQQFYNGNFGVDHWTFTDSTGAEYRLDKQVNQDGTNATGWTGIWASSTDTTAIMWDSNANRLWFPSGMFWQFDCLSIGAEGDLSARYPTLIEDTNGNQILIRYKAGIVATAAGVNVYAAWPNSSGRIDQIEDVRAQYNGAGNPYITYQFNYNGDFPPHLTSITNNINTSEGYTFAYNTNQTLMPPWGSANFGSTTQLATVTVTNLGLQHQLSYESVSGGSTSVLSKVVFPYGGYLAWAYADGTYSGGRKQREVQYRYLSKDGTAGVQTTYSFFPTEDATSTMRASVSLDDPGGIGRKEWFFNTSGAYIGLIATYKGRDKSSGTVTLQQVDTTWSTGAFGPYISSTTTKMNPDTSNVFSKRVDQAVTSGGISRR